MTALIVSKKIQDLKLGANGEEKVLEILNKKFKSCVKKYHSKYCEMDYYIQNQKGDVIQEWELKTRRVNHNQYPSLVFGRNKYEKSLIALKNGVKQTYLFNCNDGLYYWNFSDEVKQKDEFYFGTICNQRRRDKEHDAVFIKTQYLTLF